MVGKANMVILIDELVRRASLGVGLSNLCSKRFRKDSVAEVGYVRIRRTISGLALTSYCTA